MTVGLLLPRPDADSAPFWRFCTEGELRVQACGSCGRSRMPPRPMCPMCQSFEVTWEPTSGRGRIWSFVVAHPPLLAAYAAEAPYNVAVIELHDDPSIRFVGNVVTGPDAPLNSIEPADLAIGQPVHVCFAPDADGIALPRWVLQ